MKKLQFLVLFMYGFLIKTPIFAARKTSCFSIEF